MVVYIDLEGLHPDTIRILNLKGEPLDRDSRLLSLAQSVRGYRHTIITGPTGANFWSTVGGATDVLIEPEHDEYKSRTSVFEWAANQVTDSATAKKLKARKTPPTRGALVEPWYATLKYIEEFNALVDSLPPPESTVIFDYDFKCLETEEVTAMDWEWNRETKEPTGLAVSDATRDWYVPVRSQGRVFHSTHLSRHTWSSALRNRMPTVFHNGRADIGTQYDGDPIELCGAPIDDTLVMAYLVDPNSSDLSLKTLTPRYLGRRAIPYPGEVEDLPLNLAGEYAAASDTRNTYDLRKVLVSKLIEMDQWGVYTRIERPLIPIVSSMEKYGVCVDMPKVLRKYKEHVQLESALLSSFKDLGYYVRHNRKQDTGLRNYVTDILGFDPGDMDQRTLSGYPQGEIDLVLYFKRIRTRRNNFLRNLIKGWGQQGHPAECRIFPQYNQAGIDQGQGLFGLAPRTGRFSSSGPNFQQQPRDLRDIYIPPVGYKWWKYDYSQLELRIAANLSGDKNLIEDLLTGDPHGNFRQYILDTTRLDPGRPTAKTANFEKLYFGGDGQLIRVLQKERIFIDRTLARAIGQAHASRYNGHYDFAQRMVSAARNKSGVFYTPEGRQRKINEIFSTDSETRSHGERAGVNHIIQGYAADIVKLVMSKLVHVLNSYGAHMAITVHDELDGWVPEHVDLVQFDKDVRSVMESINIGPVPLVVDGFVGESWAG